MNYIKTLLALGAILAIKNSNAMGKEHLMRVKHDLYKSLIQEMGLKPNFMELAQGNFEQANDLKNIYNSSHVGEAQQKLNAFCKKWKLEPVTINE